MQEWNFLIIYILLVVFNFRQWVFLYPPKPDKWGLYRPAILCWEFFVSSNLLICKLWEARHIHCHNEMDHQKFRKKKTKEKRKLIIISLCFASVIHHDSWGTKIKWQSRNACSIYSYSSPTFMPPLCWSPTPKMPSMPSKVINKNLVESLSRKKTKNKI